MTNPAEKIQLKTHGQKTRHFIHEKPTKPASKAPKPMVAPAEKIRQDNMCTCFIPLQTDTCERCQGTIDGKTDSITPLKAINIYESGCVTVVRKFLEIHFQEEDEDLPEYFWVGDKIGDVLTVGDYWLDMENIADALRLRVPVDIFFSWYDQWVDTTEGKPRYNLEHYTRLARCTHPIKSPAKDAGEGETNYFICDDCKKPC